MGYPSICQIAEMYPSGADLTGIAMPELRVTVTRQLDDLLSMIVESGLFATKADAVRAAAVYFLKDLGWLEKPLRKLK